MTTAPDQLKKLTDEQLLDCLGKAYHAQKEARPAADFSAGAAAHNLYKATKQEALRRMRAIDPVLRKGKHGT
jgi:hypothetical protein